MVLLAKAYRNGQLIPHDYIKSYAWFSILSSKEPAFEKQVNELRESMSLEEVERAENLSLNYWKEINFHRL